jgi:hypothetical protein
MYQANLCRLTDKCIRLIDVFKNVVPTRLLLSPHVHHNALYFEFFLHSAAASTPHAATASADGPRRVATAGRRRTPPSWPCAGRPRIGHRHRLCPGVGHRPATDSVPTTNVALQCAPAPSSTPSRARDLCCAALLGFSLNLI